MDYFLETIFVREAGVLLPSAPVHSDFESSANVWVALHASVPADGFRARKVNSALSRGGREPRQVALMTRPCELRDSSSFHPVFSSTDNTVKLAGKSICTE